MPRKDIEHFVIPLGRALAQEMGFELVDAELVKEGPGRYLRLYLDKPGGFSLDDCERFHRAVQPRLDAVDYDFLEVSSPGVDRPLKTERDFSRALDTEVEVRLYRPQNGQKVYQGILRGYDGETVRLFSKACAEMSFARRDAALIKPVVRFDEDVYEGEENE